MKLVAEYLEVAYYFKLLAEGETNPTTRAKLEEKAQAHVELARKRAQRLALRDSETPQRTRTTIRDRG